MDTEALLQLWQTQNERALDHMYEKSIWTQPTYDDLSEASCASTRATRYVNFDEDLDDDVDIAVEPPSRPHTPDSSRPHPQTAMCLLAP